MTERLDVIRAARADVVAASAELEEARARYRAAVADAMANRIVGRTTAEDVARAAGVAVSRVYQLLATK